MALSGNNFLDHGLSDESDRDDGYDSEAAELSKGARTSTTERGPKRRKLSHSETDDDEDFDQTFVTARDVASEEEDGDENEVSLEEVEDSEQGDQEPTPRASKQNTTSDPTPQPLQQFKSKPAESKSKSKSKPGVIYLSSLPPYLKPSALRNLLQQRSFTPITRLFLAPSSKATSTSKKNSRQLYTEGWIEFASKKTARRCAESLNATTIGGRKGGFYHDDLWNMKYLKGMGWDELMAGIREERREEEGRRDEERRVIARETKRFVEGVEEGRRVEGMKRKRKAKKSGEGNGEGDVEVKRSWNQFEVKGGSKGGKSKKDGSDAVGEDVKAVLGKIF